MNDQHQFENKKESNQHFHVFVGKKQKENVFLNKIYNSNSTVTFRFPEGKKCELFNANSNIKEGFITDHNFENK